MSDSPLDVVAPGTLPWHTPLLLRLQQLVAADQLPNALALTSAPGWGHDVLLARAALSLLGVAEDKAIDEFAHPDFRWLVPDGAVIKIDQIRRLNEFAVQTPQMAPRKVAAVLDAHLLNPNAANALLKTLEEPPPNTHVLLATPYWGKLLPTIRSRCQRFHSSSDNAAARQWLQEQGVIVSDLAYAEFGFAPLSVARGLGGENIDLTAWLTALSAPELDTAVDQVTEGDVATWLARWYRRILLHLRGEPIPRCTAQPRILIGFSDELLSARRQIESTNAANAKLLLEGLITRWLQLQRASRN